VESSAYGAGFEGDYIIVNPPAQHRELDAVHHFLQ
jgi:hypothetical protein